MSQAEVDGARRDARVDGLRGVAILGVLVLHFTLAYGLRDSPLGMLPRWLLGGLTLNGNYGVTMFFVVSGYLITSRWLGRHSYEVYLTHILVLAAMRNVVDRAGLSYAQRLPWLALFLALSCVAGAAMARFVAEPANAAIRRRLSGARTSRASSSRSASG